MEEREGGDITAADMVVNVQPSEIAKFYAGQNIFITGGTGFIGQLVIEKLLRSCPLINQIYILIRPKNGKTTENRFREMFSAPVFGLMKKKFPYYRTKLTAINGDITLENLGLSSDDQEMLKMNINFVIHCACIRGLNQNFRQTFLTNVKGVMELLNITKTMMELKSIVYVSSAYSCCPQGEIDERFYNFSFEIKKIFSLLDSIDDEKLSTLTPSLINPWPNISTYTLAIAESVIQSYEYILPIAVIRPVLVTGTYREPIAGWMNNTTELVELIIGIITGPLHCAPIIAEYAVDIVPLDYVTNLIIAVGWDNAKTRNITENQAVLSDDLPISIYNYASSNQNKITWGGFIKKTTEECTQVPTAKQILPIFYFLLSSDSVFKVLSFVFHVVPGFIFDLFFVVMRKTPKFYEINMKMENLFTSLGYFTHRQWLFQGNNTKHLLAKMSPTDRSEFNFDIKSISWGEYIYTYVRGIRVFILDDPIETTMKAKTIYIILQTKLYVFIGVLFYLIYFVITSLLQL